MYVKLLTYWREKELCCVCLECNRCRKDRSCELIEFKSESTYDGIRECMDHSSYKKVNGRVQQRR